VRWGEIEGRRIKGRRVRLSGGAPGAMACLSAKSSSVIINEFISLTSKAS
jgi:hypothetical protein